MPLVGTGIFAPRRMYGRLRRNRRSARRRLSRFKKRTIGQSVHRLKMRATFEVYSSSNGQLLNAFRTTQPDDYDGTGHSVTDWNSFAALYDMFRVTYIKIKWIPANPNDTTTTTKYAPIYVFTDFDSIGLTPTNADIVGYDNMRVKNAYLPWTYGIRVPKMYNASSSTVATPGWMDTLSPSATGAVYIANTTNNEFTASTLYGHIVITYWVVGKNRR